MKDTSYRWLNLLALCENLFPDRDFHKIRYFTAKVKASKHDPTAPTRQETYWRALRTISNLEIVKGNFVRWPRRMPQFPLAYIWNNYNKPPQNVQVQRTEEKGSDVNLAAYLIYDNCMDNIGESIIISNDSDLAEAIWIVTNKLGRTVIVVNPNRTKMARKYSRCKISKELQRVATKSVISINENILAQSQFISSLVDAKGNIIKPTKW